MKLVNNELTGHRETIVWIWGLPSPNKYRGAFVNTTLQLTMYYLEANISFP